MLEVVDDLFWYLTNFLYGLIWVVCELTDNCIYSQLSLLNSGRVGQDTLLVCLWQLQMVVDRVSFEI